MRANTPDGARKEGRRLGELLTGVFTVQPSLKFKDVSELAQFWATDLLGYRDAEVNYPWVEGFISAIMGAEDPNGPTELEKLEALFKRVMQPLLPPPGDPQGKPPGKRP